MKAKVDLILPLAAFAAIGIVFFLTDPRRGATQTIIPVPTASPVVSVTTTPATVFPAGRHSYVRIANQSATGNLLCSDDNVVASSTHWTIVVTPTSFFERSQPQYVSGGAFSCVASTGTIAINAEAN
jgi:hypothetical protein